MKHFLILPAVAGAFLLASCELEEQIEPAEETYTKAFIKEFGVIDPKQDWNMATRGSVTVNTPSATEVKVYGLVDGEYRLMGDFGGVSGSKTLEFDMPRGTENLQVSAAGWTKNAKVGETVNFAGTRSVPVGETDIVKVELGDKKVLSTNDIIEYRKTLPETGVDGVKNTNINQPGVTSHFYFVSKGAFTIYPVYCESSQSVIIGVAYKDDEGIVHRVPVYQTHNKKDVVEFEHREKSDAVKTVATIARWGNCGSQQYYKSFKSYYDSGDYSTWSEETLKALFDAWLENNPTYTDATYRVSNDSQSFIIEQVGNDWEDRTGLNGSNLISDNEIKEPDNHEYRSQGITITIEKGKEFVFYIQNTGAYDYSSDTENNSIRYSSKAWNEDNALNFGGGDQRQYNLTKASTYVAKETGHMLFGMEDWYDTSTTQGGSDNDLNDVVFLIDGAETSDEKPETHDEDKPKVQTYILAAEDLGNLDDFDFNDMIIEVSTPTLKSGTEDTYELKVKVLAAGGTLPLKIYRDNEALVDNSNNDEIHAMFGVSTGTMVNTDNGTVSKDFIDLKTIELTAEQKEAFTITSQSVDETNKKQLTKMGGFSFIVDRGNDGTFTTTTEITAPDNGTAPQMMCLPGTWKWPTERTNINDAYNKNGDYESGISGFIKWCGDYTNTTWLNNAVDGKVVSR